MTSREPEWSQKDQAIVLAALDADALTCRRGHPIPENLKYKPGDEPDGYVRPQFEAQTFVCLWCEAEEELHEHHANLDEEDEKAKRPYTRGRPGARIEHVKRTN